MSIKKGMFLKNKAKKEKENLIFLSNYNIFLVSSVLYDMKCNKEGVDKTIFLDFFFFF